MSERGYFVHASAYVDQPCVIGKGTKIWHFCHVMAGARVGRGCVLGQGCYVAATAVLGDGVRVQNNVSIYDGVTLEDDVFVGPSCVFTNVRNPRAERSCGTFEPTLVRRGATLGANATVRCGVTVGRHAFVGAGAVVVHDVADYGLVLGSPARQVGWISRHGHRLRESDTAEVPGADTTLVCPESGWRYELAAGRLRCLDMDEDARFSRPQDQPTGGGADRAG